MRRFATTCILICCTCYSWSQQHVQLNYNGSNETLKKAILKANEMLKNDAFYEAISKHNSFDNTSYSGSQIIIEMKSIKAINVTTYFKKHTPTTARTQSEINVNRAKLKRSLASIVNTLIHETIHAVDWLCNRHWDYTHRTQYPENPPVSAPYTIGKIAEGMAGH